MLKAIIAYLLTVLQIGALKLVEETGALTLGAFGEDIDVGGTEQNLTAVQDDHLFTSGDDIRVPDLNYLYGVCGGLAAGGDTLMRLEAPSIRDDNRLVVNPLNGLADADVEPSDPIAYMDLSPAPRQLVEDEILRVRVDSDTSAAAFQWCVCIFSDGKIAPLTPSEIVTVRATSATTLNERAWSTCPLTFADELLVGRYQVVGLRYVGNTAVAARLVFKGRGATNYRPGTIGVDSQTSADLPQFRMGRSGVFGEFSSITPPDIECLADSADSAQTFDLDLVRVSG